jgi:hypothetical protein
MVQGHVRYAQAPPLFITSYCAILPAAQVKFHSRWVYAKIAIQHLIYVLCCPQNAGHTQLRCAKSGLQKLRGQMLCGWLTISKFLKRWCHPKWRWCGLLGPVRYDHITTIVNCPSHVTFISSISSLSFSFFPFPSVHSLHFELGVSYSCNL